MKQQLAFAKMHGAGNDFVVLAVAPPAPPQDAEWVAWACDRRRGVGADGALWMQPLDDPEARFRMHFYNCDGQRANLCLNGARCCARRAFDLGWAESTVRFRTEQGTIRALDAGDAGVTLEITGPAAAARAVELPDGSPAARGWVVDTGDPHLVVALPADHEAFTHFEANAAPLRHWTDELPAGANVHFVATEGTDWQIRSFERGIEGETLACGSGGVSAVHALAHADAGPIRLRTRSGDTLVVTAGSPHWTLTGPAVTVATGQLHREGARATT